LGLPVVYLVGLVALFAAYEFSDRIPGSGEVGTLAVTSLLLLLPSLAVVLALRGIRRRFDRGKHPLLAPGLLLRLSMSLSPVVAFAVSTVGGWSDFVWRLAGDSYTLGLLLAGMPLLVAELPRMVLATQAATWLEVEAGAVRASARLPDLAAIGHILRLRFGWVLVVSMPWVLLCLCLDALSLSRPAYAFALGTSPGVTGGFLLLLVVFAVALPTGFRAAFGATREIPEPTGSEVRSTAVALGFRPDRVYLLPTGMSAVNAMMVGPLPLSRCLCVTDGLVHLLDAEALSGVVAHEVGHARMGHPGLLVLLAVILPLMLMQPLGMLPLDDIGPVLQVMVGSGIVLLLWLVVRALAHRFELEADVASVRALGAGPCSRALLAVSDATMSGPRPLLRHLSTLHPDESTRLATMTRYQQDPAFRQRFDTTGRRLRLGIMFAVVIASGMAGWAWSKDWPFERAIWRFHSGDLVAAQVDKKAIGADVPDRWREVWEMFDRELAAAVELAPGATDWPAARDAFDRLAWSRGVDAWVRNGPADADTWFALAADGGSTGDQDYLLRYQVYWFCRAARDGDVARMEAIRAVILRRPLPPELEPVFR